MEFFSPTRRGESSLTEKRSRFIGHVLPAADEDEAKSIIEHVKSENRDARHNPWCYLLHDGTARSSDDGEPSGTSGAPMLELLRHENICGAVVVVTRYFGGILLGPGGLSRAYTAAAKAALEDSGVSLFVTKTVVTTRCPYSVIAKLRHEMNACGGVEHSAEYTDDVIISALFDAERVERFREKIIEITAGAVTPEISGEATVLAEK